MSVLDIHYLVGRPDGIETFRGATRAGSVHRAAAPRRLPRRGPRGPPRDRGPVRPRPVRGVGPQHELIPLDEPERWAEALAELPHGHAHTWGFCRAVAAHHRGCPTYLYRYERGAARVVCPLCGARLRRAIDVVDAVRLRRLRHERATCAGFPERLGRLRAVARLGLRLRRAQPAALRRADGFAARGRARAQPALRDGPARLGATSFARGCRRTGAASCATGHRRRRLSSTTAAGSPTSCSAPTPTSSPGGAPAARPTSRRETMAAIAALDDVLMVGAGRGRLARVGGASSGTPRTAATPSSTCRCPAASGTPST